MLERWLPHLRSIRSRSSRYATFIDTATLIVFALILSRLLLLGEPIAADAVPETVRRAHPYLYNYQPPVVAVPAKDVAGEIGTEAVVSSVNPAVSNPVGTKRTSRLVVSDEDEEKEEGNTIGPTAIEQAASAALPVVDDKKKKKRIQPVIVALSVDGLPPKEVETVGVKDPQKDVVVEYSPAEYPSVHHSSTIPHGISIIASESDLSPHSATAPIVAPTAEDVAEKKELDVNDTLSKYGSPSAAISGEAPMHTSPFTTKDGGEVKVKKRIVPIHISPAPVSSPGLQ